MTKWEYKEFLYDTCGEVSLIDKLNGIGWEGWEAVSVSGEKTMSSFKDGTFFYKEIIAKRCISPNETTNSSSPTTLVSY